jgi:hypothetical protein
MRGAWRRRRCGCRRRGKAEASLRHGPDPIQDRAYPPHCSTFYWFMQRREGEKEEGGERL